MLLSDIRELITIEVRRTFRHFIRRRKSLSFTYLTVIKVHLYIGMAGLKLRILEIIARCKKTRPKSTKNFNFESVLNFEPEFYVSEIFFFFTLV